MTKSLQIRCGEIWLVQYAGETNDQREERPAIIVSNDGRNKSSKSVIVVPTIGPNKLRVHYLVHIFIPAQESGLQNDLYALCDQILTVKKTDLKELLSPPIRLKYRWKLLDAIRLALGDTRA